MSHMSIKFALMCLLALLLFSSCTQESADAGSTGDAVSSADLGGLADGSTDAGPGPDAAPGPDAEPPLALDWVALPAGSFQMGSVDGEFAQPIHTVTVAPFALTRTEITVSQYRACREAGACPPARPATDRPDCALTPDLDDHPMRCVIPNEARAFAAWVGARLPTEAEWEYAARSGGLDRMYPWGNELASCTRAIVNEPDGATPAEIGRSGCGRHATWPVCSKPAGNTQQGLCDMIGNVDEWVEDEFCSYEITPTDGTAATCGSNQALVRGGHWYTPVEESYPTARHRSALTIYLPDPYARETVGFRLARSLPPAE